MSIVPRARRARVLWCASLSAVLGLFAATQQHAGQPQGPPLHVTRGAAPGYVDDELCAECHATIAEAYHAGVGMARSFGAATPERDVEDFATGHVFHEPSQQHLELRRRGGRLIFRRWQVAPDGEPINAFEQTVDFVLGSGHRSRVYLYRTAWGELYQLPLAWYAQERSFAMAPGFDRRDHEGVTRRVRRECLFCHNAYPEVPEGSDARDHPQVFPEALPPGIGCQRCHGPGAGHVAAMRAEAARARRAPSGETRREPARDAIVNPGLLPAALRDDVCFECHMQPALALPGVRRLGRGDYSFRPGQPLPDYLVQVDARYAGQEPGQRFEINHHPYRLRQSRCYQKSGAALSCLTCHDPHRKLPAAERAAHYRAACLGCHQADACTGAHGAGLPAGLAGAPAEGDSPPTAAPGALAQDCVACHMPQRRTQDVVRVVMTDHLIQRSAGSEAQRLAPIAERDPVLTDVTLLEPERAPDGPEGELYRALAVVRSYGAAPAVDYLELLLARAKVDDPEAWLALAEGQLKQRRFEQARRTLERVLARDSDSVLAAEWLALALAGLGRHDQAVARWRALSSRGVLGPEAAFNLGRVLVGTRRPAEAVFALREAARLRPNMTPAFFFLGQAHDALGQSEEAAQAYRRALDLEPSHTDAYVALGRALVALGRREEARRYLEHGAQVASRPGAVAEALGGLAGAPAARRQ